MSDSRISVRIPADTARQLELAAKLDGRTLSDAVRKAVTAYIVRVIEERPA